LPDGCARADQKKFFAEMPEAYFGSAVFCPAVTGELKQAERATFEFLAEIWSPLPVRLPSKSKAKP
jgi:hypothetical protein